MKVDFVTMEEVNVDNVFVFEGKQSICQYIKQVCIKLLNPGVYSPLLFKKYGII